MAVETKRAAEVFNLRTPYLDQGRTTDVRARTDLMTIIAKVYAEVSERGPISSAELVDGGQKSGPWWGWSKGKSALEWLFWAGDLTSAGRGPRSTTGRGRSDWR